MIIAQEPLWRRQWPWIVFAVVVVAWISNPIWPLLPIVAAAGWGAWWVVNRRQRTSLSIEDGVITIVNEFSTHQVPIEGASMKSGSRAGGTTGDDDLDQEIEAMWGSALCVIPADPDAEMIEVHATVGMTRKAFRRVATELHAAIALDG